MTVIKTLSDEVTRRIAAGEVVERPSSVVKELVENAVDAQAHCISIRTVGAGESVIEVSDDGCGMSSDDVLLAPKNFATSKIREPRDLEHISTYGFRGEALASISAVSRFEIVSSDNESGEGWRLAVDGKTMNANEPAPRERGTTISVRDLFFNTPARKRFLKSPATERKRILETILSFALILPDTEIHYVDDGRHILDLLPAPTWRDRVAAVLGADAMRHMSEVDLSAAGMRVRGFTSLPTHTRGNRNHQFFFVNRRAVREKTLVHSLQDAYRNVIPYKRFPVSVLALEVPAEDVDVNVHPAKLEVRVRNERQLFSLLRHAVKGALSAHSESSVAVYTSESRAMAATQEAQANAPEPFEGSANVISLEGRVRDTYADYLNRSPDSPLHPNPELSLQSAEPTAETRAAVESLRGGLFGDEGLFWQFDQSYIFIQVRSGLVVIDQHAAHERIIFDTTLRQLEGRTPVSQQILFRIHLELSMRELAIFRQSQELFEQLGFTLEPFGGKSILVRGYPQGLKNWEEGKLLLQIFDDILEERFPGDSLREQLVASFACRSAIKAGKKLSLEEIAKHLAREKK
ncbi:MAG: DNA mismatch repair endonuclease MutL [Candidatus Krumholzibacteriota bacterium]|nr:DNA mismatch repair endonuclease MutL [Candidatus Krumholzibacteriota bacterium]